MNKILKIIFYPFKFLAITLIYLYKILISPLFPKSCKFVPSCSTYGLIAIKRFGVIKGSFLIGKRILRCSTFSKAHGFDPVPDNIKGDLKWLI